MHKQDSRGGLQRTQPPARAGYNFRTGGTRIGAFQGADEMQMLADWNRMTSDESIKEITVIIVEDCTSSEHLGHKGMFAKVWFSGLN
jgi:hypothetical protein